MEHSATGSRSIPESHAKGVLRNDCLARRCMRSNQHRMACMTGQSKSMSHMGQRYQKEGVCSSICGGETLPVLCTRSTFERHALLLLSSAAESSPPPPPSPPLPLKGPPFPCLPSFCCEEQGAYAPGILYMPDADWLASSCAYLGNELDAPKGAQGLEVGSTLQLMIGVL